MSTAVRTAPTGYSVLSQLRDEEDEDAGDGESTIPQRSRGRTPPPPARRSSTHSEVSSAQRGPITPEPLTAPPTPARRAASGPLPVEPPPRAVAPLEPPPSPRAAALAEGPVPRTPTDARARRLSSPPVAAPPRRSPTPVPRELEDDSGDMTMPIRRQSVVDAEASVSLTTPMRRLSPLDEEASQSVSLTTPMRRMSSVDVETSESVSLTTPMRRMSSVELEPSVSITPATVSHRAASRPLMPAARASAVAVGDDDDHFHTDSSMSGALTSPTASLRDGEDDESTMGYGGGYDYSDTSATPARTGSRGLVLVVVGGLLLLVLLSLVCWGLYTRLKGPTPLSIPLRDLSQKALEEKPSAVTVPVRSANPPPVAAAPVVTAHPAAGIAPAPSTPEAPAPTPGVAAAPELPAKVEPAPPSLVEVRFEGPPKTVLRQEGGERLPVNRLVSLPPGPLRVDFDCPGRRTGRGTKSYLIEQANPGPLVLPVPCKPRR
jgi:serine/threonine-protein kinase